MDFIAMLRNMGLQGSLQFIMRLLSMDMGMMVEARKICEKEYPHIIDELFPPAPSALEDRTLR